MSQSFPTAVLPWLDDYRVLSFSAHPATLAAHELRCPTPLHTVVAGKSGYAQHGIAAIWVLRLLQEYAEMQAIVLPHKSQSHDQFWQHQADRTNRITVLPHMDVADLPILLTSLTRQRQHMAAPPPTLVWIGADYVPWHVAPPAFWAGLLQDWNACKLSLWVVSYSITQTPWAWTHMQVLGMACHDLIQRDALTRQLADPDLAIWLAHARLGEMLIRLPSGRLCFGWLVPRNPDEYYLLTTWC